MEIYPCSIRWLIRYENYIFETDSKRILYFFVIKIKILPWDFFFLTTRKIIIEKLETSDTKIIFRIQYRFNKTVIDNEIPRISYFLRVLRKNETLIGKKQENN